MNLIKIVRINNYNQYTRFIKDLGIKCQLKRMNLTTLIY